MKKNALILLSVCLVCTSMILGGCVKKEEKKEKTKKEETVKEEKLKSIGVEAKGKNIYKITLENQTGKGIIGVSVKDSSMAEYPANMLAEGDVFVANEKRNLFCEIQKSQESAEQTSDNPDEKLLEPQIDVQLTFDDQTVMVLTAFPFEDMKEGKIYLEDEVAFLQYKSVASKELVSTKESELTIKAEAEAQAAAEAEAAAKAQAEAEAAAKAQAEAAAKKKQQKQQSSSNRSSGGSGDGCVNDGLVY